MPKFRFEAHSVIEVEAKDEETAHTVLLDKKRDLRLITASGRIDKKGRLLPNTLDCALSEPRGTRYEIRSERASIKFIGKI